MGNSLDALRDRIQKKAKGIHISRMSESEFTKRDNWLPTPAFDLNRILSGNLLRGLPLKTWAMIVGPEHSFKSSFMALTMAEAQKKGMKVIVFDTEGAWDDNFVSRWGLDPENILHIYTPWVDEIKVALAQILESGEENLAIVMDSIGGIDKKKIYNDAIDGTPKADQGGLQKDLKPMYKLLLHLVKVRNSIAVSAGHYYGAPGQYGNADEIGGGKAAKLLPDLILSLRKYKLQDKEKNVIGNQIKAITLKNRLYPPFNEAAVEIDFINGLNPWAGIADIAVNCGILQKGGAGWYTFVNDETGEEIKLQGEQKLVGLFEEHKDNFISQINGWLENTGFSTVNEAIKEAEELAQG